MPDCCTPRLFDQMPAPKNTTRSGDFVISIQFTYAPLLLVPIIPHSGLWLRNAFFKVAH